MRNNIESDRWINPTNFHQKHFVYQIYACKLSVHPQSTYTNKHFVYPPTLKLNIVLNVSSINSQNKQTNKQQINTQKHLKKIVRNNLASCGRWSLASVVNESACIFSYLVTFHSFDLELDWSSKKEESSLVSTQTLSASECAGKGVML